MARSGLMVCTVLIVGLATACGDDTTNSASSTGALTDDPRVNITQGVWGFVPPGDEIGFFDHDPTADMEIEPGAIIAPDTDGFYQFAFEPGETGWFCMVTGPHTSPTLSSDCREWTAEVGVKRCDLGEDGWAC